MVRESRTVLDHWYHGAIPSHLRDNRINPDAARAMGRFGGHGVENYYEGGWPLLNGDHAYVPELIQDARFDQTQIVRREIMRKSRFYAKNDPMFKRIIQIGQRYTVGPKGLLCVPDSQIDEDWNERAFEVFSEWCEHAGLNDEPMSTLEHVGHDDERVDGETFFYKTRKKTPRGSVPRIQHIESHRVESPFSRWNEEGQFLIDGVQLDNDGNRNGYWVREGMALFDGDASWNLVPASQIIHVFEPHRGQQYRGIGSAYSYLGKLAQKFELDKLEMRAQFDAAEKSTFIINPSGELNKTQLARRRFDNPNPNPVPNQQDIDKVWEKRIEFVRKIIGGRTAALKTGEDVKQFIPQRPSDAVQWYWLYNATEICAGAEVPMMLIFPGEDIQGTVARAVLDDADANFQKRSTKWIAAKREIYRYFMGWAIYNDKRVIDPPADWDRCVIYRPRAINVDVGYTADNANQALANGTLTYAQWLGHQQIWWKHHFSQIKREQDWIKKNGITVSYGKAAAPAPTPEDESEPTPQNTEPANV